MKAFIWAVPMVFFVLCLFDVYGRKLNVLQQLLHYLWEVASLLSPSCIFFNFPGKYCKM